jgi:hypothetical protein
MAGAHVNCLAQYRWVTGSVAEAKTSSMRSRDDGWL